MTLLIDGYNLLHVSGIFGHGAGPGNLERSRRALLNFLAESLDPGDVPRTTVVFDAAEAPPGLPLAIQFRDLAVRYAAKYEDADTLIEELIAADAAPRRLTVVSSDHRIQRAARRRKAIAIDSDVWFGQLVRRRHERNQPTTENVKPPAPLSPIEVEYWLRQFDATGDKPRLDDTHPPKQS
jgi:hypothetical protein